MMILSNDIEELFEKTISQFPKVQDKIILASSRKRQHNKKKWEKSLAKRKVAQEPKG